MRTPKLRAIAVVAGFTGVSLLVAGTASAMVSGHVDMPIASAVQLQQEDPTSQTPPVPAQVDPAAPVEVGSGAIKCDEDGHCASLIKVETKKADPVPQSPRAAAPTARHHSGNQADSPASDEQAPTTDDSSQAPSFTGRTSDSEDESRTPSDQNSRDRAPFGWDFDRWVLESWHDDWQERWHDGLSEDWRPGSWNRDDWRNRGR